MTSTITAAGAAMRSAASVNPPNTPFEVVNEALAATKTTQSRLRELSSRVVVYRDPCRSVTMG